MKAAAILLLPALVGCASPTARPSLTLAEARRMSPSALAAELLGRGAAGQGFVEAKVSGNRQGWIRSWGLDSVSLYRAPKATDYPGLCRVDAVDVSFDGGNGGRRDVPHRVRDREPFTRFALVEAGAADCAQRSPQDPRFFMLGDRNSTGFGTSSEIAYFGTRAVRQAQAQAPGMPEAISCIPDPASAARTECIDATLTITSQKLAKIDSISVFECEDDAPALCTKVTYLIGPGADGPLAVNLTIATDAVATDPAKSFNVTSIAVSAESWVYD